jgi:hypothetical protein
MDVLYANPSDVLNVALIYGMGFEKLTLIGLDKGSGMDLGLFDIKEMLNS